MSSPQRRIEMQNWLDKARCRLSAEDYNRFRAYVKTLKTLKDGGKTELDGGCDGQTILKELAELLWQAYFPEGPHWQQEWLIAFRQSLPVFVRGFWHNVVVKATPLVHTASQLHERGRRTHEALQETPSECVAKPQLELSVLPSGISSATIDEIPIAISNVASANATECLASSSNALRADEIDIANVEKTTPDEPSGNSWKASVSAFEVMARRSAWRTPSQEGRLDDTDSHHGDRSDKALGRQSDRPPLDGIEKDCRVSGSPHDALHASDSNGVEIIGNTACKKRLREEELVQEVAKLRQRLVCVFCRDFPTSPKVSAVCGHFGCSECWSNWMASRFECPVCRAKARPQNLIRLRGYDG